MRKYEPRVVDGEKYLFPPSFPAGILKNKLATVGAPSAIRGVIGFRASKWKNLDYVSRDGSCAAVCLHLNDDERNKGQKGEANTRRKFRDIQRANFRCLLIKVSKYERDSIGLLRITACHGQFPFSNRECKVTKVCYNAR